MTATEALRELLAALRACDHDQDSRVATAIWDWVEGVSRQSTYSPAEQRLHAALVAAERAAEA